MFKMILPHKLVTWRGLAFIATLAFYICFTVGVYSLCRWGITWLMPSTSVARQLYLAACLQAAIICLGLGTLIHLLNTLAKLTSFYALQEPKK